MSLQGILSISGKPGLFRLVANRSNGLLVEDVVSKKVHFASARTHSFSPLETIAIYTEEDSTPLSDVFRNMQDLEASVPPIDPKSSSDELKSYFAQVLPDYDGTKVKDKDIKKVITWYNVLKENDMLHFPEALEDKTEEE